MIGLWPLPKQGLNIDVTFEDDEDEMTVRNWWESLVGCAKYPDISKISANFISSMKNEPIGKRKRKKYTLALEY